MPQCTATAKRTRRQCAFFGKYVGGNGNSYCGIHIRSHYAASLYQSDPGVLPTEAFIIPVTPHESPLGTPPGDVSEPSLGNLFEHSTLNVGRNVANVGNVRLEVGFRRCTGTTVRGRPCRNFGMRNMNNETYCRHHCPIVCPDVDMNMFFEDTVRPIVQFGDVGVDVNEKCPICFIVLKSETIVKTNCGHVFHQSCIDEWLQNRQTCPLCRTVTHIRRRAVRRLEVVEYM
jgi:hypothetical protein